MLCVFRLVMNSPDCLINCVGSPRFTRLGDLSTEMGWRHDELIGKLENKRKAKSAVFHARQKALTALKAKVITNALLFCLSLSPVLISNHCLCYLFSGLEERAEGRGSFEVGAVWPLNSHACTP
jgi:hypothetical protein